MSSRLALSWLLMVCAAGPALAASIPQERIDALTPLLPERPCGVGRPIDDREAWQKLAQAKPFSGCVRRAEAMLKETTGAMPDDLFLDFSKTGNRTRGQAVMFKRHARLAPLVLAECIENRGRFLPAIEETVRALAADRTWVMPAHDRQLNNFNGKFIDVDLASSAMGREVAIAYYWLGQRLSPEVRKLMRDELDRRIFTPYRQSIATGKPKLWWLTSTANWNAVCHSGVTAAALATLERREDRAFFLAAAEHYLQHFLTGFTDDGYCYEGLGYWSYGFGNYIRLAECVRQATGGRVDWLENPKVRTIALFPRHLEVLPGVYPALSDCGVGSQPDGRLMAFLSRRFQFGLKETEDRLLGPAGGPAGLFDTGLWAFPNAATEGSPAKEAAPLPLRDWFADAGILVSRPQPGAAGAIGAAMAGCHNNKPHNHNDLGTFVVALGKQTPIVDPGSEVYTARTFSARRYESKVLNSFGHSVPRVAGQLQQPGKASVAKVLKTEFTDQADTYVIDIASAYPVKSLVKLTRTFVFSREGRGTLTVIDEVEFSSPQEFGTALLTFLPWKSLSSKELVVGEGKESVRATITTDGPEWKLQPEEIHEDMSGHRVPIRLGIDLEKPVTKARISIAVTPAN